LDAWGVVGDWQEKLRVLKSSDLQGLNVKDTASSTAAEIQNRLKAFAVAASGSGDVDENNGQRDGAEEVLEEGIHLTGAVSHGQQRRGVSWIWLGANLKRGEDNGDPEGLSLALLLLIRHTLTVFIGLFTEWAQARARALRWREEVELTVEEMQRVLAFGVHEAHKWDRLAEECCGFGAGNIVSSFQMPAPMVDCPLLTAGHRAFALQSAHHERQEVRRVAALWEPTLSSVEAWFGYGDNDCGSNSEANGFGRLDHLQVNAKYVLTPVSGL
jgi:hypothetical protein